MSDLNGHMPDAAKIAAMADDDLQRFVRRKLRDRTLHDTVRHLNDAVLSKSAHSRDARHALDRMGFIDGA